MLEWKIDQSSDTPIYIQFASYLIKQIELGELTNGKKLPSERTLATNFKISRNSVTSAIIYLQEKGYVIRKERLGTFISTRSIGNINLFPKWDKILTKGGQKIEKDAFVELSNFNKTSLHLTNRCPEQGYNFANYLFQHVDITEADTTKISNQDAFSRFGLYSLRESICEYMKPTGINAKPSEILIFSSITQILNLFANIFLNVGVNYYHENYSFITLKDIMAYSGANFKGLDMDDEGINIEQLKQYLRPIKNSFLHVHSCDHNPTGITLSYERRKEIVEFCARRNMPIIEMDSMRNLYHMHDYPPAMKSLDKNNNVIYIGSFLRPTSEAVNLAWIHADEYLINKISRLKLPIDIMPSPIVQMLMDKAIREGVFGSYLSLMRQHLASQLSSLDEAMRHYLSDCATWDTERSSYYIWTKFDKSINTKKLYDRRVDIDFNPGYFYNQADTSHISITTLSMNKNSFPIAIGNLRKLIDKKRY